MSKLFSHKKEILLVALALFSQLIVFVLTAALGKDGFMANSDSMSYLAFAKNILLNGGFYTDASLGPQMYRMPLYPLFIALSYAILPKIWFVILIQNALAVVSVVLVYRLGKLVFNEKAGFLGAILYIFESTRLVLANQLLSETLFMFLMLSAIYYFTKTVIGNFKWPDFIIASASAGLAALARQNMQFFPFYILIFFIVLGIFLQQLKRYLLLGLLSLVIFIITISPWLIRNYYHFGEVQLSSVSGWVLYNVAGSRFLEYQAKLGGENINPEDQLTEQALEYFNLKQRAEEPGWWGIKSTILMEPPYEGYFLKEAYKIFLSNPPLYIISQLRRAVIFFMESGASRNYSVLLYKLDLPQWIFYPALYFGGRALWVFYDLAIILSFVLFFDYYKKNIRPKLFLFGIILYYVPFSAMFSDVGRHRQPVEPLFFLFAACALNLFYDKFLKKSMIKEAT